MSLQKIGHSSSPDADSLKRDILQDTLYYNIHEQQTKHIKKHLQKQKQLIQDTIINRRVSTELNQQIQKAKDKKRRMKQILAHQYDKQIQERRLVEMEQAKRERGFAKAAEDRQKDYYDKRGRELMRIYRAQRTLQAMNPESQQILKMSQIHQQNRSRIRTQVQPYQSQQQPQQPYNFPIQKPHLLPTTLQTRLQQLNPRALQSQPQTQPLQYRQQSQQLQPLLKQPSFQPQSAPQSTNQSRISQSNSTKLPQALMQPYKEYLKEQIERKRHQKEEQVRHQLELEKQLSKNNYAALEKEKEQLREIQRKQKQVYKKGLDQQVAEKYYFRRNF